MTPPLRSAGYPSPLLDGTHLDDDLPPPIPFDATLAGKAEPINGGRSTAASVWEQVIPATGGAMNLDAIDLGDAAPKWLSAAARLIRPLSVGALMAIPTLGTASVGIVAMFDEHRGMAMARASITFLGGLPGEIVILIGALATGYGVARTVEKLKQS
jgi:hypothetical protein